MIQLFPTLETPHNPDKLWSEFSKHINNKETPFLLVDLNTVKEKFNSIQALLPSAKIHYAVKANPAPEILKTLNSLNSHFDIASTRELDLVLAEGVSPDFISYGNTIKKEKDIKYAFDKGIDKFACDSETELLKQATSAPGSKVFFRIITDGAGADWPLSKKFGCHPDMILSLAKKARDLNLVPYGLSFHVGSQQRDIGQWDNAIAQTHLLMNQLKSEKIEIKMLNLGGGLPCTYLHPTQSIEIYINEIKHYLTEHFGDSIPEIYIEPGRALVGDAGVIVSEVILVSKKTKTDLVNWLYLDIGLFGGLIECLDEAIKYPIYTELPGPKSEMILAGPTCDSMDILYKEQLYLIPNNIKEGDRVYFFSTGAYTTSYSSVDFNGIKPLSSYYINA